MATPSIYRDDLFAGKTALITGGGTGIGKRIAVELKSLGAKVVIASRKEGSLQAACADIEKATPGKGEIAYFVCDIRKEEQVHEMVDFVIDKFGSLDLLTNNAGGQFPAPASAISTKGWKTVIDLNLNGTFVVTKVVFDKWMFEHGGSVVNIVANYFNGFPMMAHTGAARAAVANLTKTLSVEWACAGVRVNSVAPGIIFNETADKHYKEKGEILGDQGFFLTVPYIPAKRLGTVDEVSSCVTFLHSPGASYVTGAILRCDGAQSNYGAASFGLAETDNFPCYGSHPPSPKPKL